MKHRYRVALAGALAGVTLLGGIASADQGGTPNGNSQQTVPVAETGCAEFSGYGPHGAHFTRDNLETVQDVNGSYPSISATLTVQALLAAPPCKTAQYQLNVLSFATTKTVAPGVVVSQPSRQLASSTTYTQDPSYTDPGTNITYYPITWTVHFNDFALLPGQLSDQGTDGVSIQYDGQVIYRGQTLERAPDAPAEYKINIDGAPAVSGFY